MIKGINYWAFPPENDGSAIDHVKAMKRAKELGYDAFEITIDAQEGPVSMSMSRAHADLLRNEAEKIGIQLKTVASGSAWGISPSDPDRSPQPPGWERKPFCICREWFLPYSYRILPRSLTTR